MFPNAKVTAFTVSGLLWENQQELPPQITVNIAISILEVLKIQS